MQNINHTFVIHSCSEDLNLLQTVLQSVPVKVFDTQLAAAFLGLGFSLSYQSLVKECLGIEVAKDETRSDWLRRPLTATQIAYAASDVRYLLEIQDLLQIQLINRGMLSWFEQECTYQLTFAFEFEQEKNWETLYAGVSNAWRLNDEGLKLLQSLCYWREREARLRNKPRSWIAKDNDLMVIAKQCSLIGEISLSALMSIDFIDRKFVNRYGVELVQVLTAGAPNLVDVDRELVNNPISVSSRKKLKACQEVIRIKAEELRMAPELLGRKKQLLELIRKFEKFGEVNWSAEMSGWRRHLLEPEFNRILAN